MAGHDEDRSRLWPVVVVHVATGSCPSFMKLNHINLYSHDTEADRAMFEQYSGLRTLVVRGTKMAIMQDNDGLVLIVNLHIGFIQKSREDVDALYRRLSGDGWHATNNMVRGLLLSSEGGLLHRSSDVNAGSA